MFNALATGKLNQTKKQLMQNFMVTLHEKTRMCRSHVKET